VENWCYEPEALALFATHYKTGEMIPMEYVQKLKKALVFRRISTTCVSEFWIIRYGMAVKTKQITDVKPLKPKTIQPQNYTQSSRKRE
jgi:peptidyl-dipeptidase Dcp